MQCCYRNFEGYLERLQSKNYKERKPMTLRVGKISI